MAVPFASSAPAAFQALSAAEHALTHTWVAMVQFHGIVPCLLLGTLWMLSGIVRLCELRNVRKAIRCGSSSPSASPTFSSTYKNYGKGDYPEVTLVLPTRGIRSHSPANWQAVLQLVYAGPVEFIFVLESEDDPAYAAISNLRVSKQHGNKRCIRIVIAGRASNSSQKICNLMGGIEAASPSSAFLLCLDDDVHLHPATLASLINDMMANPSLRVATGYPFDVPIHRDSSVLTYAALAYHLPLVIGFSLGRKTQFIWGGCMLFRTEDLRKDSLGVLKAWADGGYSDDLTVAARCSELGVPVFSPTYAIFPQWLDADYSFKRYWNYLRRQLYVLDTYASPRNRHTNYALAALHCYGSCGFVFPVLLITTRMVLLAVAALISLPRWLENKEVAGNDEGGLTQRRSAMFSYFATAMSVSGSGGGLQLIAENMWLASACLFMACAAFMAISLWWMTVVMLELMEALNPAMKSLNLKQHFNWTRLWCGFLLANALCPLCMAYTFVADHVEWAGIKYRRRRGKVVSVCHGPIQASNLSTFTSNPNKTKFC